MKECFDVTGMSCAACQVRVEKSVGRLDGVSDVNVNLLKNTMEVVYDENSISEEAIVDAVSKAGYGAIPRVEAATDAQAGKGGRTEHRDIAAEEYAKMKKRLWLSLVFTVPLFYISMGHMMGWPLPPFLLGDADSMVFALTLFLLAIPVAIINRKFFIGGFRSLMHLSPNMDSLIAIGSGAALVYGIYAMYRIAAALGRGDLGTAHAFAMDLYFESAAMILTLITLGKTLEARAKGRTSDAIRKLMDLAPKTAVVERDGVEVEIPIEKLRVGDAAIVRAGASIPADGHVVSGGGAVDESAITGESIPVDKAEGDGLTGATILRSGYIRMAVDKVGADTALEKIIRLVDDATSSKAPIAKLADKVSGVFVPIVIAIALVSAICWLIAGKGFEFSLSIAISVLVISCPCALGLATPTAIMVGTGRGASSGILIKSAEALETLHSIDAVVLDKTGTITEGRPAVTDIIAVNGVDPDDLLSKAASLEKLSGHPLGEAIVAEAERRSIKLEEASGFAQSEGRGVSADIAGRRIAGGNRRMLPSVSEELSRLEEKLAGDGKTPLFFTEDGRLVGIIALADTIKPTSRSAIEDLRSMGIRTIMLTGDNRRTAEAIQRQAGADSFIAEVLPSDKESEVRRLQKQGLKVAMVGDGINDAPALARADVGIAIGAGTDIAIESADIVLMKSDLRDVPKALELGKATMRNIKENLFWALFYNAICIPVAAGVLYPAFGLKLSPMIGAFAMSFSSVFVVSNALRLRFFHGKGDGRTIEESRGEGMHCNAAAIELPEYDISEEGGVVMKKTLKVNGMMCQHCVKHVHDALSKVAGVDSVDVSLEDGAAVVGCSEAVSDESLRAAVVDAGYEVSAIEG